MNSFGQIIKWTEFNGRRNTVEVRGFNTANEALFVAIDIATRDGWTRPKWWQWWRWHDTRPGYPKVEL